MEEVFKMAEDFETEIKDAYIHSRLPATPDNEAIDNLLLRIYRECEHQDEAGWQLERLSN